MSTSTATATATAASASTSTCTPFSVKEEYGYVLFSIALIAFQCILTGFLVIGKRRSKYFSEAFMKNFEEEHKSYAVQGDVTKSQGYPDMGNGRYSAKLPYSEWLDFNKAQRVHYNFLEQFASVAVLLAIGGLYYPIENAVSGFIYFVARIFYVWYLSPQGSGHPLRRLGAVLGDLVILAAFVFSVLSAGKFACWF